MPAPVAGVDGNWECPQCGNVNFAVRTSCNRCQAPIPPPQVPMPHAGGGRRASGAPIPGVDGNWECPNCHNVNFPTRSVCNRCQTAHPGLESPRQVYHPPVMRPVYHPPVQHVVYHPPEQVSSSRSSSGAPIAGVDGNWACPLCENVNFAVRSHCNRCGAPREAPRYVPAPQAPPPQHRGGAPVDGVDGNWRCHDCGNVNFALRSHCNKCQAPKPAPVQHLSGGGAPRAGVDGNWLCSQCQNVNFAVRTTCNRCGAPRRIEHHPSPRAPSPPLKRSRPGPPEVGVDGNWACPECNNVNYGIRDSCNRCGAPKGDAGELMQSDADLEPLAGIDEFAEFSAKAEGRAPVPGVNGNWECVHCHNVNFGSRAVCNRCQAPPPQKFQPPPSYAPVHAFPPHAPPQRGGAPVAGVDGNWECPNCSNVNFGIRSHCNRCQASKPVPQYTPPQHAGGPPRAGVDGNWACPQCQNVNFSIRTACNRCGAPRPTPRGKGPVAGVNGNWVCPQCQNVNFGGRLECNRCNEPKPEELMSDDALLHHLSQPAEFGEPLTKRAKFS